MNRPQRKRHFSVILPIYHYRPSLLKNLEDISQGFKKNSQSLEIICVLDSSLKKSASKLKPAQSPEIKTLFYPLKRLGKGFGFCYGFNQSTGDLIFFWEGNFHITAKQLLLYINLMDLVKADIVVGSKRHPLSSVSYSLFRRFISKIYQLLVKTLFGLNLSDTQVGLKLYQRQVLKKVIPKIIIKNWAFDLEILVVAHNSGFKRIIEAPVEIKKDFTSQKLAPANIYHLLQDTLAIFYRKYILKYYQQEFV